MIIALIGSSQYREKFAKYATELQRDGHRVLTPAFDDYKDMDELKIAIYNRGIIEVADEVHIIWDARSSGTIFDFGMAFALRKKVKVVYLSDKTFSGLMEKYQKEMHKEDDNL